MECNPLNPFNKVSNDIEASITFPDELEISPRDAIANEDNNVLISAEFLTIQLDCRFPPDDDAASHQPKPLPAR